MKMGQPMSEERKSKRSIKLQALRKKLKNLTFTEEEKALIIEYCDERIAELLKKDDFVIDTEYVNFKQRLKEKVKIGFSNITAIMFEDCMDMVWNREYLDHRHNNLNISILEKMQNSDFYKNKCKMYEIALRKYKESQKIKNMRKKNENLYRQAN